MHKFRKTFGYCLLALLGTTTIAATPDPQFNIRGMDASHHQGQINWRNISPKNMQFVYLKASEGGDYTDPRFQENWLSAREQGLRVGAYHVFRLCRDGKVQADNFIHTVPKKSNSLPPVLDLEYDSACLAQLQKDQLLKQIQVMHDRLQQHYGKTPIFYTTPNFYHMILMDSFQKTPIWIRSYQAQPQLKDRKWLLWQYSNQGKISGINTAVDLNVFQGNAQDWKNFLKAQGVE